MEMPSLDNIRGSGNGPLTMVRMHLNLGVNREQ